MTEKEDGVVNKLYRVVRPGKFQFDEDDNLVPHKKQSWLTKLFFPKWVGKVPMVTESDIEYIREYFGVDEAWTEIEINPLAVIDLKSSNHPQLRGKEYFGKVNRTAILNTKKY